MEYKVYELHKRYEQEPLEETWERLLVIFFVEKTSESGIFVLPLLVKRVEGAASATKMLIGVVLATEGRSRRSGASLDRTALVAYFYRIFVLS